MSTARKRISLALQGGGSHGAFTWGVLDRLLADERLEINGISGTSAGSINAALAVSGLVHGGRDGARKKLHDFWDQVATVGAFSPFQPNFFERLTGQNNLENSPLWYGFDMLTRMTSPYQFNPLGLNPLRDILTSLIDYPSLHACHDIQLFISATNVRSGALKVFHGKEVSVEALLASACLPYLFQAVEIDGEAYWDGGYMGNPTLYPLIHQCMAHDIVIVQINPIERQEVPRTSSAIMDRLNEISFNSSLLIELKGLRMINQMIAKGQIDPNQCGYKQLHLHMIHDEDMMRQLNYASKMNVSHDFLEELKQAGMEAADQWLQQHFSMIGEKSSIDFDRLVA